MTRPFVTVATDRQWTACTLDAVRVAPDGAVELVSVPSHEMPGDTPPKAGDLTFDRGCRAYRTTADGGVERILWSLRRDASGVVELHFIDAPDAGEVGGCPEDGSFLPGSSDTSPLERPVALAADDGDRFFVAEEGKRRVLVYDLWSLRLLRRVDLAPRTPVDLACDGHAVWTALDGGDALVRFTARGEPDRLALPAGMPSPTRIDVCRTGRVAALTRAGGPDAALVLLTRRRDGAGRLLPELVETHRTPVPGGTDVAFQDRGVIVVARGKGQDFRRYHVRGARLVAGRDVFGRGYQGGGIARAPDGGCVAFWGVLGPQCGVDAPVRYVASGRVATARLDSGTFRTVWGRLFLDAVVPRGGDLTVRCVTSDQEQAPDALTDPQAVFDPLYCRDMGREVPWTTSPADLPFRTLEAPVLAGPGRYLWVQIRFEGDTRVSPRVRALRVQHPGHDYLRRLPRAFSRNEDAADFLQRFLDLPAGFLHDLEARAEQRHVLLMPETTPAELLPWLAGFVGLVLDDRWPECTRRALVREAIPLFRARGTPGGLVRFLELFIGEPVTLVEHFKLRGLGGAFLGGTGAPESTSVLGGGFRVGSAVGTSIATEVGADGGTGPGDTDATAADDPDEGAGGPASAGAGAPDPFAHRFTVVLGRELTEDELAAVRLILEVHRPAHTVYDLCTVGAGMRVGRGLHVDLSTIVGPTGGFTSAQVGDVVLGRESILDTQGDLHADPAGRR